MSNVKTYLKSTQGDLQIVPNFKVREFSCHDGTNLTLIDYELLCLLQLMRDILGVPLNINSGYRTSSYNKRVGGASNSYHVKGQAFDISGFKSIDNFCNLCFTIGIKGIIKYDSFVHIDSRVNQYHADNHGVLLRFNKVYIPYFNKLLRKGDNNYLVACMQFKLNQKGYNCGTVDGVFGNNTYNSLIKFQKDNNLDVDGIYGVLSHNALFNN